MKVLITGSTGFVGRHLVPLLETAGHEMFHLVRNKKRLEHEFVWDFKGPLPGGIPECDAIIHLAAYVDFSLNLNVAQYNINTISTIKLSAYSNARNAHFILASMAGIHGSRHTLIDIDTPINPENHYAMSKYLAEEVVRTSVDNYSILRIGGIYGLDGPAHLELNNSINDAVYRKQTPVLKGSGKAKRNYICVLDVARWILSLVGQCRAATGSTKDNIQETIYMAGPEIMSIEDYLQTLVETALPGRQIEKLEGAEAKDLVITESPAPFNMMAFRQYITSLL
jgi:UDP-glucose 4-epimerase